MVAARLLLSKWCPVAALVVLDRPPHECLSPGRSPGNGHARGSAAALEEFATHGFHDASCGGGRRSSNASRGGPIAGWGGRSRGGPAGGEADQAQGREEGEAKAEAGVAGGDVLVDVIRADGGADVGVHVLQLLRCGGGVGLTAGDVGDPFQLGPIDRDHLAAAVDLDVAVLGAVGDGVDRYPLVPSRRWRPASRIGRPGSCRR